ncbi:hypothetical protein DFH07DRAFT_828430 [Mycena maculata]|uniref:Uncharacterized protein n=1 Tax=Mycena maculata TaxID=230809 RepID=A0AAD7N8I4_9AGAR|nr:hypothetical protein DFH07DRAFT_828430 [Mycena maculata]
MPVSFVSAPHPAIPVSFQDLPLRGYTPEGVLALACPKQREKAERILQSAFSSVAPGAGAGRDFKTPLPRLIPDDNGFVNTVIRAYNDHHALVIRPDDVWLAILGQFNFFVNANAEVLRASFVAHEGQRELEIGAVGTHLSVDFGYMSREMVGLLEKNIIDPTLREWAMPSFTTTTATDVTVGAILMMSTLKQYFHYTFNCLRCGIPRVTLEGERADWVDILTRLEKLKEYGIQTVAWYHLLRPVISRFVAAFDAPTSRENVDFWQRVVNYERMGSGPSYYTGWLNAFSVFNPEGVWLGHWLDMAVVIQDAPETLSPARFWDTYGKQLNRDLVLDGTPYHQLESHRVPPGTAEINVKLDDQVKEVVFDCAMVAGMVGMQVSSSHDLTLSSTGTNDVVQPVSGWFLYTKKVPHGCG